MVQPPSSGELVALLDDQEQAEAWLRELRIEKVRRGYTNLVRIAEAGVTLDLLVQICGGLVQCLPSISDPDMALNNLERFIQVSRSPLSLASLFDRDSEALPVLLQMFSSSQYLSDLLIQEPETYDLLRITEGTPVSRAILVEELLNETRLCHDERHAMTLLRAFKRREIARIAYGDFIRAQRLDTVTRQISYLADAICEAALAVARELLRPRYGQPHLPNGKISRFAVLALGKLGGMELNYSSDIDLIFIYEDEGETDGKRSISNHEYFDRLARNFVKLLTESSESGTCYRVDLRLRPNGRQGPMVISRAAALKYYDVSGRTWERQAFVKARSIAGDSDWGNEFLEQLAPWIYRSYLSRADITGIKALKRRLENRSQHEGQSSLDVKTGHGGIRDIEFVIQFLQLLNGGDLAAIRTGNTLEAITQLEQAGCLTMQERTLLAENYAFLRKIEHRLQMMFDLQTHSLPRSDVELQKLAIRMGYVDQDSGSALQQFQSEYQERTAINRKILDHLLHDAFDEEEQTDPEVDLVLDPDPSAETIQGVLGQHGFQDVEAAYRNLSALAREKISFLSTRRCRHFLAAIAPSLLAAIARTPDPDATLVNLSQVSDSLGGKGVLWELFSVNPASLQLYVRLCAGSPYLSTILMSNPGMIDELMDSLVLDRLPDAAEIRQTLEERCRGAEDVDPILHSFKNSMHLRVGVRDILGKEDIRRTTETLSDIAESCLQQITLREYHRLRAKYGVPSRDTSVSLPADSVAAAIGQTAAIGLPSEDNACELIILGVGKLGGREPNYHSDLDVIFLYENDGQTRHPGRGGAAETTTNQHFFSELGQRIIKYVTRLSPYGRLYEMDPRLRPTGRHGALAVSLAEFSRYFAEGDGQLWERQALCKARTIFGSQRIRQDVMQRVQEIAQHPPWEAQFAGQIADMRMQLQATASPRNLKRGPGGTVDVEFLVQMLQLRHGGQHPEVLLPGTLQAIEALRQVHGLSTDDADYFAESYRFLRRVESRLRLMNTTARHDLPQDPDELEKLAYLLGETDSHALLADCRRYTEENRRRFRQRFAAASDGRD